MAREWQLKVKLERNRSYLISATLGVLKIDDPEPSPDEWFQILKETRSHAVAMFKTIGQSSGWEIEIVDRTENSA